MSFIMHKVATSRFLKKSIQINKLIIAVLLGAAGVARAGDDMIGTGLWRVLGVEDCEKEYPIKVEVTRRKVDRTHDGFNVKFKTDEELNETYEVRLDVCKKVDGGCKPYQVIADACLPCFLDKYAAGNLKEFLTLAGVDPASFPLAPGQYEVENFEMNYEELPEKSPLGQFRADAFMLRGGEELACKRLHLEFADKDDER